LDLPILIAIAAAGERVESQVLRDFDRIDLGDTVIVFEADDS